MMELTRLAALCGAVYLGFWIWQQWHPVDLQRLVSQEKGVYRGPTDTALTPQLAETLSQRATTQR